jgi:hypothetical protein
MEPRILVYMSIEQMNIAEMGPYKGDVSLWDGTSGLHSVLSSSVKNLYNVIEVYAFLGVWAWLS